MNAEIRPRFWDLPLADLTTPEWEALCDGCGKCCCIKVRDRDTQVMRFTRLACPLLDHATCRCTAYGPARRQVSYCNHLTPENVGGHYPDLPATCAYRLRHDGQPLPFWHHLLTSDPESVHRARASVSGLTYPAHLVSLEGPEWQEHIIKEPGT